MKKHTHKIIINNSERIEKASVIILERQKTFASLLAVEQLLFQQSYLKYTIKRRLFRLMGICSAMR